MPASRSARAMIFAPRSCPSRPGLATTTRILRLDASIGAGSYSPVGVVEPLERPALGQPAADGGVQLGVERRDVRAHPGADGGVVSAVARRIDVDASDHLVAAGREHRVRE